MCSGSRLAAVSQIFSALGELKDGSEKPQSGRRLTEREKHQEKKRECVTVSHGWDVDAEQQSIVHRVQEEYKVNPEENNSKGEKRLEV